MRRACLRGSVIFFFRFWSAETDRADRAYRGKYVADLEGNNPYKAFVNQDRVFCSWGFSHGGDCPASGRRFVWCVYVCVCDFLCITYPPRPVHNDDVLSRNKCW